MENQNETTPDISTTDEPARKKRGALLVHEKLREDIQWMRIAPGSALDEVALARQFDVSRTPIREALLLLANEGFVHFLQNRTTIVAPLSLQNQSAFLDTFILLSRALVRAAASNNRAEKAHLDEFVTDFAHHLNAGNTETAFRALLGLFRQCADLAQNFFLAKYFIEAQDASVRMRLLYYFPHMTDQDKTEAIARMQQIVTAMRSSDPDACDKAVQAAFRSETGVIQRGLGPRFGHDMDISPVTDTTQAPP